MHSDRSSYIFIDHRHQTIEARLSCLFYMEDGWHYVACPELGLEEQGSSQGEAFDSLAGLIIELIREANMADQLHTWLNLVEFHGRAILPERTLFRKTGVPDDETIPFTLEASLAIPIASLNPSEG